MSTTATAIAHPNIALVKYWGKRDAALNLPATGSLSLTLDVYRTRTILTWGAPRDRVVLGGTEASAADAARVLHFLDRVDGDRPPCEVVSENNFPTAAGLASSSSAFAALALAAVAASGQQRSLEEIAVLARRGSGSATRSLWGGWVIWPRGERPDGTDSHGAPLAPEDHWDVRLVVGLVSAGPKPVGSTVGMVHTERTSPLYAGWVESAEADLLVGRQAVVDRDLRALGEIMEHSAYKMHATMLAARPHIRYWRPETIRALEAVESLRKAGVPAYATMDAGPNVKVLCDTADAPAVAEALRGAVGDATILAPGGPAHLLP